ncbi:MAG: trypsin-like serine protease [Archangiaceae bacterium]|nr:trypsin-like serine protease [Archangiaceae bacterium]
MMRRLSIFFALLACGTPFTPQGEEAASREDAIIGGTIDTSDPEVFELIIQGNNGSGASCTATLIDRRTLLTAAHCVDPRTLSATSVQLAAHNKANDNLVGFSDVIRITETRYHPGWQGMGDNDIAMALLQTAPAVTPKAWNMASLNSLTGQSIRAVGYGASMGGANPTGGGVKRQVNLTFRQMFTDIFFLGDGTGHGVCHGDSGGPSFHTFSDGVERVVGVHSFTTTEACTTGADTRVDYFQSFIKQWLMEKEAASCIEDGRCASSCATPDLDCVCARDGQCTAACPNVAKDPDCPADCAQNGVCSQQACPTPDTDCVANGQACAAAVLCPDRLCERDEQHVDPYCTRACSSNGDCFAGGECDTALGRCRYTYVPETQVGDACTPGVSFCALATRCAGPTVDFASCSFRCSTQADCADGSTCTTSFDGTKYCQAPPKPPVVLQKLGIAEAEAASSCSAVGGLLPLLAALVLRRRRGR